jgi:hypothetical protein
MSGESGHVLIDEIKCDQHSNAVYGKSGVIDDFGNE